MRNTFNYGFVSAALGVAIFAGSAGAADQTELKTQKDKVSYSIGMQWGNMIKRSGFDVDTKVISEAINDVLAGKDPKMTEAQSREAMMAYQKEMAAKKDEERKASGEKNRKAGEEFLAANKTKEGIKTHTVTLPDPDPTKADKTITAEFQYKVLKEGTGEIPKSNDVVNVTYRGTTIDGKEFDNSAKHGDKPAKFPVNRVVRGWTEALQMMKVGSKWMLYLPSTLAYGDMGAGPNIEPGSTLIFEMELVSIDPPVAPPAPAQPLTSDIIRVPSAEELKKGAKIEVMKPEDVEKARKEAEKQQPKK